MEKILLVNKPKGISSNQCIQTIKKNIFGLKIGHAGTLDPLASGLLVVGIGKATKKLNIFSNSNKEYMATIQFNKSTSTYDSEGEITNITKNKVTKNVFFNTIKDIEKKYRLQEVPIFSSIKINGRKLYEYARKNQVINLPKRKVKINKIEIISFDEIKQRCEVLLNVTKGFYVRSFANDLGKMMNNYGYLKELKRIKSGDFSLENAINYKNITWRNLFSNVKEKNNDKSVPLIIGFFDGIHKGHSKLFNRVEKNNFDVLTFEKIPRKDKSIFSLDERIKQILKLQPRKIYCINIIENNMTSNEFIKKILGNINPSKIIVGNNFYFGSDFKNYKYLTNYYKVEAIKKDNYSTTRIKKLIHSGKLSKSNKMLNSRYSIFGKVINGKKVASSLGYPTANILISDDLILPKSGSYATLTKINNKFYKSISFVGNSKTLGGKKNSIETYIFDFNEEIYGLNIQIDFLKFIRKNKKFSSKENLIKSIKNDILKANRYFNKNNIIK